MYTRPKKVSSRLTLFDITLDIFNHIYSFKVSHMQNILTQTSEWLFTVHTHQLYSEIMQFVKTGTVEPRYKEVGYNKTLL